MNAESILSLYDWAPGVCFRHPSKNVVDTAVVKRLHARLGEEYEVRACGECVLAMEDIRREAAGRLGRVYEPGHAGEALE